MGCSSCKGVAWDPWLPKNPKLLVATPIKTKIWSECKSSKRNWVNMCKNIQITTKMSEYKHPADCILKILRFPKCSTSQRFSALGSPDPTDSKKHVLRVRNSMFRRHPSRVFQRFRTVFGNRCLYQNTTCWWLNQPS